MLGDSWRAGLTAIVVLFSAACAGRMEPALEPGTGAVCRIGTDAGVTTAATVALSGPVSWSNAPVPTTSGERVVFRQLYETLTDVDCQGQIIAGLASDWSASADSTVWSFNLRRAAFSDGSMVTAMDVVEDWYRRGVTGARGPFEAAGAGRTVELLFATASPNAPELVSDRRFAVTKRQPETLSHLGTTGFAVATSDDSLLVLEQRPGDSQAVLEVTYLYHRNRDQRDLLDRAVHMLVTDRPEAIDYAREIESYRLSSLPWARTYFVALDAAGDGTAGMEEFTSALARDAVRSGARAHRPPSWWDINACAVATPASPMRAALRVGTVSGDRPGREIAERLVFVAGTGVALPDILTSLGNNLVAVTYGSLQDLQAEASSDPIAILGYVDRFDHDLCGALSSFRPARRRTVVPLIDTREELILHRDAPAVIVTGDGVPRFEARQ